MSRVNRRYAHAVLRDIYNNQSERDHKSKLSDKEGTLDSHTVKVEMVAEVLLECLTEIGVTKEEIELKVKEIMDRGWTINPSSYYQLCPNCGKKVFDYTAKEFEATCMYCGQIVHMYPGGLNE